MRLIDSSPLFDRQWYLKTYPDVADAGIDPAVHYLDSGWTEGRDPGPQFATSAYLRANGDVARAGLNPLLHYIEFGESEGREVRGHPFAPWKRTSAVSYTEPAAPVYRGQVPRQRSAAWVAWHRLTPTDERLFSIGQWKVGYAEPARRLLLEQAFAELRALSGFGEQRCTRLRESRPEQAPLLVDAWYVTQTLLRTRWAGEGDAFVVRAFQHEQGGDGELKLVADSLVVSPLDVVEISLANPYSPVLLVFADVDGTIRGTSLLPFPSLCRGGVHYSELLASTPPGQQPDPLGTGRAEAARLVETRGSGERFVGSIAVDTVGADGRSPLFQSDFRAWLAEVVGVAVSPLEGCSGPAADLLGQGATASPAADGGVLVLAGDMIPTIHALCAPGDRRKGAAFVPLVIAGPDPSQPATVVSLPPGGPASIVAGASGYAPPWPRVSRSGTASAGSRPAAIRLSDGRELADSELLVPAMDGALPAAGGNSPTITWLVAADEWEPGQFLEAARALSLQSGSPRHTIGFIGESDGAARGEAARLFRGRVRVYRDLASAVHSASSDFIGYLGPGVILHDSRTVAGLVGMLEPGVDSASCVLLTADKRGKSWYVGVADGGKLSGAGGAAMPMGHQQFEQIWRASFPVERPPRDLWVARADSARQWFGAKRPASASDGLHLCTTMLSASYAGHRRRKTRVPPVPPARPERSTAAGTLFG